MTPDEHLVVFWQGWSAAVRTLLDVGGGGPDALSALVDARAELGGMPSGDVTFPPTRQLGGMPSLGIPRNLSQGHPRAGTMDLTRRYPQAYRHRRAEALPLTRPIQGYGQLTRPRPGTTPSGPPPRHTAGHCGNASSAKGGIRDPGRVHRQCLAGLDVRRAAAPRRRRAPHRRARRPRRGTQTRPLGRRRGPAATPGGVRPPTPAPRRAGPGLRRRPRLARMAVPRRPHRARGARRPRRARITHVTIPVGG